MEHHKEHEAHSRTHERRSHLRVSDLHRLAEDVVKRHMKRDDEPKHKHDGHAHGHEHDKKK